MAMHVELDGTGLRAGDVERIARGGAGVRVTGSGWARIRHAHGAVRAATGAVYGRTTGVGANKNVAVEAGHGLRLLRSHSGGAGDPQLRRDDPRVRRTLRAGRAAWPRRGGGRGRCPGGVLSMGAEEHASFATQSAHRLAAAVGPAAVVVACELVAAVRALRQSGRGDPGRRMPGALLRPY